MENANQEEVRQWVVKQTAYLDPPTEWHPDSTSALMRFHARTKVDCPRSAWRRRPVWAAAAVLVAAIILLLLLPAWRVVAQQLWQFLTVPQVAFVRVNPWPEGVPS